MQIPLEELRYVMRSIDDYCESQGKELRQLLYERGSIYTLRPPRFHATPVRTSEASQAYPLEAYEVFVDRYGEIVIKLPSVQN